MEEGEEGADFGSQGAGVLALEGDGGGGEGGGGKEVDGDGGEGLVIRNYFLFNLVILN